jgi:hypothetical protein
MQLRHSKLFLSLLLSLSIVSSLYLVDYNYKTQNHAENNIIESKSESIFRNDEKKINHEMWTKVLINHLVKVVII